MCRAHFLQARAPVRPYLCGRTCAESPVRSSVNVTPHATQRTALLRKPPSGEDDRPNDRSIPPILAIAAAREPQKCEGAANAPDSRPVALTRVLSGNADQQDGNAPTAARAKIARIDRGRQLSLPRLQVARLPPQLLPVGTGAREPSQPGPRLNHPHQPQRTPQLHLLWPRRYPTRATLLPIPLVPPLEPSALQVPRLRPSRISVRQRRLKRSGRTLTMMDGVMETCL